MWSKKRAPHQELTDPKNEKILASLKPRSWHAFAVLEARAKFLDLSVPPEDLLAPVQGLIHTALQSSGSIDGEHRKDLTEAVKAAQPAPQIGLAVKTEAAPPKEGGI